MGIRINHLSRFSGLILFLLLAGCSLLEPPPRAPIGTPEATAETFIVGDGSAETSIEIIDPAGTIRPGIDPDIQALINAVSQQQLQAYVQKLQGFGTRNSFSETESDTFGIGAARRWIFSEFDRVGNGRIQVTFENFPLSYDGLSATERNVVATLPGVGNHPGVLVIGGHYDSRVGSPTDSTSLSPSADDNASSIAMLLELARLMSARTWNQTIVFVAFASEEQGTVGSRYFVTNSIINNRSIDLFINNDIIGGRNGIPQAVRLFAPEQETSIHGELTRYYTYINNIYSPNFPPLSQNIADREGRYGDQREFINAGIPSIRITESEEDESLVNSPRDVWTLLDFNYLAAVTKLNLAVVANWAGAPQPPAAPAISRMAEPGNYLLTWPTDPQAAGYAISFRPAQSLTYPEFRYVDVLEAGKVRLTGINDNETYAVSIAPISSSGRLGGFSREFILSPATVSAEP